MQNTTKRINARYYLPPNIRLRLKNRLRGHKVKNKPQLQFIPLGIKVSKTSLHKQSHFVYVATNPCFQDKAFFTIWVLSSLPMTRIAGHICSTLPLFDQIPRPRYSISIIVDSTNQLVNNFRIS